MTMDFDPGSLFVSFLISGVGFVLFSFGKKMERVPQLVTGLVLMVFPYFVSGILPMLGISALLLVGLWVALYNGW
jgi:hypothetical protein